MADWFIPIGVIFYFLFVIYASNQVDAGVWSTQTVRGFLYSLTACMFLVGPISMQAVMISTQTSDENLRGLLNPLHAAGVGALALVFATFSYNLVRSDDLRAWVAGYVRGYNPDSSVHLAAALLTMLVLLLNLFNFVLSGGVSGVAENIESAETFSYSTLLETALFVIAGVLGVGYAIRRTMPDTLARLGLRFPTQQDAVWGIGTGLALYGLSVVFALVWAQLTDPETFARQTEAANQLSSQIRTIPMALLISTGSAFGEEIFMRGALQPVFGVWLTSGFFALLHSQYLLTPTMVFIFVLSVIFGWLRWRVSTTSAIIAHFVYNFTPTLLLILLGGAS